jgi:hypothetical protein
VPRVVLDAVAEAHLLQHLEVVLRALLEALRLEQLALALVSSVEPLAQLLADRLDGRAQLLGSASRSASRGRSRPRRASSSTLPRSGSISVMASISSPKNSMRTGALSS